jgi:2-amino-4-hydroxy-6-hydroxymethyldihydropteridine diphosphokinase
MRAYLGLGSNLGNRRRNIAEAIRRLGGIRGVRITKVSSLYETTPVGGPPQPDFLNAVARVETTLSPARLLDAALAVEAACGRMRAMHWGPRVIDIDVLLAGARVVRTRKLTLPHPRMHERRFVLAPLAEIAPRARHPRLGKTARAMLATLSDEGVRRVGPLR